MLLDRIKSLTKLFFQNRHGNILLVVMIFGTISFTVIVTALTGYAVSENSASNKKHNTEMALQIADAGINYYRWHLAHDKTDYYDGNGTSTPGPYVHEYKNKDGNVIGQFSLVITPPSTGSTVVTIESTGSLNNQPNSTRVIKARVGFPSLADFAVLQNANLYLTGPSTGKVQANGGIRFEGTANAPIMSAMATYTCPTIHCGSSIPNKQGVWGGGGPVGYWQYPVPAKDFTAVTAKLAEIRSSALAEGGGNWPYLSSSGNLGWRLQFVNDGTVRVSKVLTCTTRSARDVNPDTGVAFTVSPAPCLDAATFGAVTTYPIPTSSYVFVEDNVWVYGILKGRVTVGGGAGKFMVIHGDLTYLAKDGTNTLGLIADQNIFLPYSSPNTLNIDAALLSQNGTFKRYNYSSFGGPVKTTLNVYGSRILYKVGGVSWLSGSTVVSGYPTQSYTYDNNLTYGPPPGFPVGSEYNLLSWEVVK
ncbi:MAG: hypothetical protein KBC69_02360 [Candidatus Magasanikbacteria bacterium]|nr:hypothetical protein [Candidatus Magasanikbacteria bacterium]